MTLSRRDLQRACSAARARLLAERTADGHWVGELASSALATATASWALHTVDRRRNTSGFSAIVTRALDWLAANANDDGGWGDTVLSRSNLSTTVLVWSALAASSGNERHARAAAAAQAWIEWHVGRLDPPRLAAAVADRYGRDRTFSAPILTMAAMAGRLGEARDAWRHVPSLRFELAACPHVLWRMLSMEVVSYALPALVAVGQARHHHRPPANPVLRLVRSAVARRTLDLVTSMQPASGGFLEAAPLTSFVTMSLADAGHACHPVVARGAQFLASSVRSDGSLPIDTNLATWVTTLAVRALAAGEGMESSLAPPDRRRIADWLIGQQHRREHPYTRAAPGGWAWTDLPGGVPDADDTAGALIALRYLARDDADARDAAASAVRWLLDLQNRDGGIPTFCRGWGRLPFDRSAADLTAHAIEAWQAWRDDLQADLRTRVSRSTRRALEFLARCQRADGAWAPLWFGNETAPDEENLTYGTSRVVAALAPLAARGEPTAATMVTRGTAWLLASQNQDGGWGGGPACRSTIEETALALAALAEAAKHPGSAATYSSSLGLAIERGAAWLVGRTACGTVFDPAPIGLYFARLWYFERLYPVVFAVSALERLRRLGVGR